MPDVPIPGSAVQGHVNSRTQRSAGTGLHADERGLVRGRPGGCGHPKKDNRQGTQARQGPSDGPRRTRHAGSLQRPHRVPIHPLPPSRIDALTVFFFFWFFGFLLPLQTGRMPSRPLERGGEEPGEPSIRHRQPLSLHSSVPSYRTPPACPSRPGPQLRGSHRQLELGNVALSSPVSTGGTGWSAQHHNRQNSGRQRAWEGGPRRWMLVAGVHRPIRGYDDDAETAFVESILDPIEPIHAHPQLYGTHRAIRPRRRRCP